MHAREIKRRALELSAAGLNDCEVARRTGVPRTTMRDWRRPPYRRRTRDASVCPRCWRPTRRPVRLTEADYSELLGLYLGDGHIARTGRSDRLRIFLDSKYAEVIDDARALLGRCLPEHRVGVATMKRTTTILSVYCTHLACLLPQHGPGRKHERSIVLEPWQHAILGCQPWPFLRGCIRSDGCVFVNRTGPYEYVSYDFANRSQDILALFAHACDLVGVEYRAYARRVRIYRRASVALMQQHVGEKR